VREFKWVAPLDPNLFPTNNNNNIAILEEVGVFLIL
jgi:hypothetical protein